MKSWLNMWKHTFCYTGKAERKEYWQALLLNVAAMYAGIVPYSLILRNFTTDVPIIVAVYMILTHLPVLAIYFRRANDAGWKVSTTIYVAIVAPIISALLLGFLPSGAKVDRSRSILGNIFALSFGLFLYGGIFGLILYDDVTAIPFMPTAGLLLASGALIGWGIVNWRAVLAFFS